jgi:hypothetical protein
MSEVLVTVEQREMMLHALGGDVNKSHRNYYAEAEEGPDHDAWTDLVDKGLAECRGKPSFSDYIYFSVSEKGIEFLRKADEPKRN